MNYEAIIKSMQQQFGPTVKDICIHGIGVLPEEIHESVILAPWWEPYLFPELGEAYYLSESDFSSIKVWNIVSEKGEFTYIKTGIGSPILMDVLLCLGETKCKKVIMIGSSGSLDADIDIGSIVIPKYSVCGDGASRYLVSDDMKKDCFGEKVYPDPELFDRVKSITENVCRQYNVKWHIGRAFGVDTIVAHFTKIDLIRSMDCNIIEMECAAAFRAAKLMNIQLAAIFCVSDNSAMKKSLSSEITKAELDYRKFVRRKLFPQIILETFRQE